MTHEHNTVTFISYILLRSEPEPVVIIGTLLHYTNVISIRLPHSLHSFVKLASLKRLLQSDILQ